MDRGVEEGEMGSQRERRLNTGRSLGQYGASRSPTTHSRGSRLFGLWRRVGSARSVDHRLAGGGVMILAAEIALTIAAWRRGWRGWALVPVACAFAFGALLGVAASAGGGSPGDVAGVGVLAELMVIVVLAIMVGRRPRRLGEPRLA
jgi:hypothetical protein